MAHLISPSDDVGDGIFGVEKESDRQTLRNAEVEAEQDDQTLSAHEDRIRRSNI